MIQQDDQGRIVNIHEVTKTVVQHVTDRSVITTELEKAEQSALAAQALVDEIKQDLADYDRLAGTTGLAPAETPSTEGEAQ